LKQRMVNSDEVMEALAQFNNKHTKIVSIRKFILANIDELRRSGRPVAEVYEHLTSCGFDCGSLKYFQKLWSQASHTKKHQTLETKPPVPEVKSDTVAQKVPEKNPQTVDEKGSTKDAKTVEYLKFK